MADSFFKEVTTIRGLFNLDLSENNLGTASVVPIIRNLFAIQAHTLHKIDLSHNFNDFDA